MSNSVRPHRRQPTRLPRPWDSPGKNTGVGCRFLLQCMKVKSESEVAQSYLTLRDPMDCSPPGSSIHGIFQARVLEWGAIAFSTAGSMSSIPSQELRSHMPHCVAKKNFFNLNSGGNFATYLIYYYLCFFSFLLIRFMYLLTLVGLFCSMGFLKLYKWDLLSSYGIRASHHCRFSCGALALGMWASVAAARGLSSCGSWALEHRLQELWCTSLAAPRHLPGPGIELLSPALQGGFLTMETPGKP